MPFLSLPRSLLLCADQVIGRIGDDRYDSTLDRLVSTGHYGCCSCLRFDVGSSTPGNLRRRPSEDRSRHPLSLPHARLGRRSVGPAGAVSTDYWWRWTVEAFADRGFVVITENRSN